MKIVFVDNIDLPKENIDSIKTLGDVEFYPDKPDSPEKIIDRCKDADLLVTYMIHLTKDILQNLPRLHYVVAAGAGFDRIDINTARELGIKVLNCPTHNFQAVAEFTIGLMFAVTNNIVASDISIRNGFWKKPFYTGRELNGKILGLIGFGKIGKKVAEFAKAFDMKVIHTNSSSTPEDIDNLLTNSDIVSLHLPLNNKTQRFIDKKRLKLMKKGAYFINTARGAIVDQKALIKVLKEGHLAGAALDVFDGEPITNKASDEIVTLAKMENVVATSHIAFHTEEAMRRLGEEISENIKSCINNKPINVVNN